MTTPRKYPPRDKLIGLRLPAAVVAAYDREADRTRRSRTTAMLLALEIGAHRIAAEEEAQDAAG